MWGKVKTDLQRLGAAFVFFLVKLILAGLLVAADLGLEKLAGLVLEHDGDPLRIVEFVLDVTFVGSAVVIAVSGALVVTGEVILSSRDYFRERNRDD